MPSPHDRRLDAQLAHARARGLHREPPPIEKRAGLRYRLRDRDVVSFCTNDYLGFASEPVQHRGPVLSGSGGSRLVSGDSPSHRHVEAQLAALVGAQGAVLFPSGFQLNVGVLPSVLPATDHAHSDRFNHASIVDGLRLAAATRTVLPHLQPPLLRPDASAHHRDDGLSWWISESIFSMDGDGPAISDLDAHLEDGGCVYLDEAHAFGLFRGGQGRASQMTAPPTALVAPLGKAFGCAGAFVAGSATLCSWLRSRARSFVFSTGLAPVLLQQLATTIPRLQGDEGDERRARLWTNVALFRRCLARPTPPCPSPIFPIHVGDNDEALALSAALFERGWHAQPIRPPTVPEGSARLRVTVSAAHTPAEIEAFAADVLALAPPFTGPR